jgi:hypothetical protein
MDFTNTDMKPSENEHYKSLLDSILETVSIIALIYNKKGKPIDFYTKDLNLSFAKLCNKTKQELLNKKITSVTSVAEDLLKSLLKKNIWLFRLQISESEFHPKNLKQYALLFKEEKRLN